MKRMKLFTVLMTFVMAGAVISPAWADSSIQSDLAQVRDATDQYHNLQVAVAAGYHLVPGRDYCFDNPGVGAMGYHYINTTLIANPVEDPLKPDVLVYAPGKDGHLHLAAVEYVVPMALVSEPPVLFGHTFEPNYQFGTYTLHAWIWRANTLGMFYDWNPSVSCNQ